MNKIYGNIEQSFKNTFNENFYTEVQPQDFPSAQLISLNTDLLNFLNLSELSPSDALKVFSGQEPISNSIAIAQVYAGHQFGNFVPQLGDGRAKLLGDVKAQDNLSYDIQLKGSGPTAYSRSGDGLSALGPVIREYILSEAMFHLNIPTTRALAALSTGEVVYRQNTEPGGIFARVAKSHIRVGSFEYFLARNKTKEIKMLADFCIQKLYPEVLKDDYLEFFKQVCHKQIQLVAKWMSFGFIHGVMNTDNTSIAGETIDYGPCAFMDEFDFYKKFSFIDRQKRYCYINQAQIIQWNLSCLAQCLLPILNKNQHNDIQEEIESIAERVEDQWIKLMSLKLGFESNKIELVKSFLQLLQTHQLDFTLSFRHLSDYINNTPVKKDLSFIDNTPAQEAYIEFIKNWKSKLPATVNKDDLNLKNPLYIARNHQVQKAIDLAYKGDYSHFQLMNKILKNPFIKQNDDKDLFKAPQPEQRITTTFCGT